MISFLRYLLCCVLLYYTVPTTATPLYIGVETNAPLFERDHEGFARGLYADLIEKIAATQGWEIQFVEGVSSVLLAQLQDGVLDMVIGVDGTHDYGATVVVSENAILERWLDVFVRQAQVWDKIWGHPLPVRDFLGLHQQRIAVRTGWEARTLKQHCLLFHIECAILESSTRTQVLQQLTLQEADVAILDNISVLLEAGAYAVESAGILFAPLRLHIAVHTSKAATLLPPLETTLAAWRNGSDPFYQQRVHFWLKSPPHSLHALRRAENLLGYLIVFLSLVSLLALMGVIFLLYRRNIFKQHHLREADTLRRNERHYRALIESLPYGLQEIDVDGTILFSNTLDHQIRRYAAGELLGRSIFEMMAFEKERKELHAYWQQLRTEQPLPTPYHATIVRKDGEFAEIRAEWNYKRDEQGHVIGFYALISDVTESELLKKKIIDRQRDLRDTVEQRAADLKQAYTDLLMAAAVFENTDQGILVMNASGMIENVNPAFLRISGYDENELCGRPWIEFISKRYAQKYHEKITFHLQKNNAWQGEMLQQRKNGKDYPAWASINAVLDSHEQVKQYVVLLTDISRLKKAEQEIWRQAHFDTLTGLPNRNLFYQRLSQNLEKAAAGGYKTALMFIDLDHFKEVNDTLGHDAGDDLLKQVSARLKDCVPADATVARMGGDEFTVILGRISGIDTAEEVARQILKKLACSFDLSGRTVNISGSVGVVLYPDQGKNMTALLKNADIAMYQAKEGGRDAYRVYCSETVDG
jgi:diguanylate cyclase (GGDEF)-like protein/PAS domain S-box-containing protein